VTRLDQGSAGRDLSPLDFQFLCVISGRYVHVYVIDVIRYRHFLNDTGVYSMSRRTHHREFKTMHAADDFGIT